jgi:retron-type reverse transcriptase
VARAIVQHKTRVIDIDLKSYFDNVRHDRLLAKVAERVDDGDVMRLLKVMLKANGKQGVPQGGVISPLLKQPLPHRGGHDAGAGEGGHTLRQVHQRRICEVR